MAGDLLAQIKASTGEYTSVSFKTIERFCDLHGDMYWFVPEGNAVSKSVTSLLKTQKKPLETSVLSARRIRRSMTSR